MVSAKTSERLKAAQEAISYAKQKLPHGAGNQMTALEATNFNSYYRMQAARDDGAFNIPPAVKGLANDHEASFLAAKAELVQGGNCGEHAFVAYDYLRRKYPNEHIQIAQVEGFDHAFVLIGDPAKDGAGEVVVADAWPTKPTPVLWEDHFAYTTDSSRIQNHASSHGDARDYKQEMLDAGLSLNTRGQQQVQQSLSPEETKKTIIEAGPNHWLWNHEDTAAKGRKYDYLSEPPAP